MNSEVKQCYELGGQVKDYSTRNKNPNAKRVRSLVVRFWYSCYNLAIESARQILEVLVPRAMHTLASSVVTIQLEPDALAGRTSLVSAHRIWIFWIYVKLTLQLRDFLRDAMGKKNITDDMKRAILELQKEGKSYAEIAARLGVGKATVHLWVIEHKGEMTKY